MTVSACDVVDHVVEKLEPLGYSFNGEGYGEVLEALGEVEFFRDHGGRLITLVTEWMKSKGYHLTPDTTNKPGFDDYILEGESGTSAYITVRNLQVSVKIAYEGVVVDILPYPMGDDAFQESIASTYAFWAEGYQEEEDA